MPTYNTADLLDCANGYHTMDEGSTCSVCGYSGEPGLSHVNTKRTHPVCSRCRSPNVLSDAYAEWDHEAQQWVLQNTFDKGAFCQDCDGETSIDWEDGDPVTPGGNDED